MTRIVNILVEVMTSKERALLTRAAQGKRMSQQEFAMLEKLRLAEVEPVTGLRQLSDVGKQVSGQI